ncbi:MAG TPA: nuclear transport factor 2 family protein [Solirubrobacteraceae bacterium]|nr:nuclear transport factor 2 family protein [Solirubrobacteraceae bacterium]
MNDRTSSSGRDMPWLLEDEWAITRLMKHYCRLLDSGGVDRIAAETFAADGVADYQGHVTTGRQEINDYLVANIPKFDTTAHLVANVWIHWCDGEQAEVTSNTTVWHWWTDEEKKVDGLTNFVQIVKNDDRLVRTDEEGWRIVHRRVNGIASPGSIGDARIRRDLIVEGAGGQ